MSMMLLKRSEQEYLVIGRRLNEVSCLTASHFHVHKTALSFGDITIASCDTFPRTMACYLSVSFRNRHLKCHKSPQFQIFTFTISNKLKGNVNHITVFNPFFQLSYIRRQTFMQVLTKMKSLVFLLKTLSFSFNMLFFSHGSVFLIISVNGF